MQARVFLLSRLNQDARQSFPMPGKKRLAAKINGNGDGAALNFTPLNRQLDFSAALITDDDVEPCADGFLEQLGKKISGIASAGAAALGRGRGTAHIVDRF